MPLTATAAPSSLPAELIDELGEHRLEVGCYVHAVADGEPSVLIRLWPPAGASRAVELGADVALALSEQLARTARRALDGR